jgi:hypothetical protein
MLQLLLERGQSYADLASVLAVEQAEVRARARAALTELAGADPDRSVGLTDYLLGQADPIGRADAVRHLKDDAADLALATELCQKLLLVAPQAELPRLPGEERRPLPRRATGGAFRLPARHRLRGRQGEADEAGPRTTLSRRQAQLAVILGCAAVLLIGAVLAATGAFSGAGGASSATSTANPNLATVELRPLGGGRGRGSAAFGTADGSQLYADVRLRGLKPASKGQTYVIWLLVGPNRGFPVPSVLKVAEDGTLDRRITIPAWEIPIALRARFLDLALAPVTAIEAAIKAALTQRRLVPEPGTTVLRGRIPSSRVNRGGASSGAPGNLGGE